LVGLTAWRKTGSSSKAAAKMSSVPTTASQRRLLKRFNVSLDYDADLITRFLKYTKSKVVRLSTLKDIATWAYASSLCRQSGVFKD